MSGPPHPDIDRITTVNVGHVVITDPATGATWCTCGRFAAPVRSDSEVTAHLATYRNEDQDRYDADA